LNLDYPAIGLRAVKVKVNRGVTKEEHCNFENMKGDVTRTAALGYTYFIVVAETECFVFRKV
jgi:hypothetical protein